MSASSMSTPLRDAYFEDDSRNEPESRLQKAISIAGVGFFDLDQRSGTFYCSQQMRSIFGWESFEIASLDAIIKQVYPDDVEDVLSAIDFAVNSGAEECVDIEHRIVRRNGEIRNVKVQLQTYLCGEGHSRHLEHTIGTVLDVTDRASYRNKLTELNAELSATLQAIPDLLFEISHEGRYLNIWAQNSELLVRQKEMLLGNTVDEMLDPAAAKTVMTAIHEANDQGSSSGQVIELNLPDGVRWFELSTSAKKPVGASHKSYMVLARDITKRRRTEIALSGEKDKYLALLRSASDGIHILDQKGYLIDASDSFCSMLGYHRDQMIGMNVIEWDARFSISEIPAVLEAQFNQKARSQFETVHRRKNGESIDVEVSGLPLVLDGRPVLFNSSRDITERNVAKTKLVQQKQFSDAIINSLPGIFYILDVNARFIRVNTLFTKITGYSDEELANISAIDLFGGKDRSHVFERIKDVFQKGESWVEAELIVKSNNRIPYYFTGHRAEIDGITYLVGFGIDITARKKAELELRIASAAFESQESLMITDPDGVILRVNESFTKTTGYTAEEAVGKTPRMLKSGRHDGEFYRAMWKSLMSAGTWQGEVWDRRKDGGIYPKWLTISAIKDVDGNVSHYVGSHFDITERKAAEEEVRYLAFYDPLTRLPNRRLLQDRLNHALASSHRDGRNVALLFLDLDHFKDLNDTVGHDKGDLLLRQVADRLISCVRESDTVARQGGDEFVVLLESLNAETVVAAEQTENIGLKILAELNRPYMLDNLETYSSASIGATLSSCLNQDIEELFKQSDIAMYQAKKAGRNTLRFFDPKMQESINRRAALENELRKALDTQQFNLYFQIQVDNQRPIGAEALIRWIHPELGLISPNDFIPLAEETGQIIPIGHWVLDTACRQLKKWEDDPDTRNLVLAVNVSARQFKQPDFAVQLKAILERYQVNPRLLKLELTESMLLDNIKDTILTMSELRALGIQLSLDDFGTGYSSLQYLKRLPINQLKIDQSFVRNIVSDSSDKAIVRTIIAMAQSLNLDVIAEGVETNEQRQFLEMAGCTCFQGYFFSKPIPIEQFDEMLKMTERTGNHGDGFL